jgi:hypothetical protein
MQNWLQVEGLSLVILPVRVSMKRSRDALAKAEMAPTPRIAAVQK